MAEEKKEKPKGPLGKLKEAVDDKEEQLLLLSTFVRLGYLRSFKNENTQIGTRIKLSSISSARI